eukprot:CAMPEP_0119395122 /NCGR_PEP_ID=MMETSP1334-20130426/132088_1 /TAXON_ID=127549 /ORGANISM="Calcidiscus leptoporus, Strain RCC1130" /LENGTH=104 /DNA_ID=CAMNT_0007418545 /DNA_START=152 /DNA_END=463 /DNA_ORIENTATION=-
MRGRSEVSGLRLVSLRPACEGHVIGAHACTNDRTRQHERVVALRPPYGEVCASAPPSRAGQAVWGTAERRQRDDSAASACELVLRMGPRGEGRLPQLEQPAAPR